MGAQAFIAPRQGRCVSVGLELFLSLAVRDETDDSQADLPSREGGEVVSSGAS